jgi:hypothetical protein
MLTLKVSGEDESVLAAHASNSILCGGTITARAFIAFFIENIRIKYSPKEGLFLSCVIHNKSIERINALPHHNKQEIFSQEPRNPPNIQGQSRQEGVLPERDLAVLLMTKSSGAILW